LFYFVLLSYHFVLIIVCTFVTLFISSEKVSQLIYSTGPISIICVRFSSFGFYGFGSRIRFSSSIYCVHDLYIANYFRGVVPFNIAGLFSDYSRDLFGNISYPLVRNYSSIVASYFIFLSSLFNQHSFSSPLPKHSISSSFLEFQSFISLASPSIPFYLFPFSSGCSFRCGRFTYRLFLSNFSYSFSFSLLRRFVSLCRSKFGVCYF
jgi:hypothetical protein